MAKTPNLQITLLEVGQNDKELTINEAISTIDTAYGAMNMTGYLGEFSSAPSSTGLEAGSSYYDLTFQVFKTLNTSGTWVTSSGGSGGGAGVDSVNGRGGVVVLNSTDISDALGYTAYNASNPNGYTANTGTVTSVNVTGNNGITQSVATGTTTPAITLGLGNITPSTVTTNNIDLNTSATPGDAVGRLKWNDTDGTLDIGLKGGNVVLQVGQEQVQRVTNNSGATIPEGAVVRVTGASGNRVTIALAANTSESLSGNALGIATETILNNQSGFITTEGLVRNIDTSGWTDGTKVFLGSIAGSLTSTHPVGPAHGVTMGYVVRSHATQGMIYVKVDAGLELDELHDVKITGLADKDHLEYNSTTGVWENKSTLTIGAATGSDGLVFTNGAVIKLTGTDNATMPCFQTAVTNGTSSVRVRGNGTGDAQFVTMNTGDLANHNGAAYFSNNNGSGLYAFTNGTETPKPYYLIHGSAPGAHSSISIETSGDVKNSFNFIMDGPGKAIQGDFSNSTATLRNVIKTSTTDGATRLSVVPNGTGTVANLNLENSSSMVNSSTLTLGVNSTESFITAGIRGTGTQLPLTLYSANGTNALTIQTDGHIVFPKTAGYGIKVDTSTPTSGWRDLLGPITIKGSGAQDPAWATFIGGISQYQFTVNDEATFMYHIPHDYVPGSDVHFHVHWAHAGTTVTGGSVTFSYEVTVAKGFDQAAFATTKTGTITQNASTVRYQHMIAEGQISTTGGTSTQIDNALIEVDGFIIVRMIFTANNMTTSGGGAPLPFIFGSDLHYQSTNIATKNKAPSFYA